jgi:hypothetical protein
MDQVAKEAKQILSEFNSQLLLSAGIALPKIPALITLKPTKKPKAFS